MSARADITVVAGGWSVANVFDLNSLAGTIIAVNEASVLLPRWDHAITMDRLWAESRIDRVLARGNPGVIWVRVSAAQNLKKRQLQGIVQFDCDHESDEFTPAIWPAPTSERAALNGRNSGFCALNLAWHLHPGRLFLLGFDMNRDPRGHAYWYPPYPWSSPLGGSSSGKYSTWATGMARARARFDELGVEVFNVSPTSAVEAFRKITPAEYRRMTR